MNLANERRGTLALPGLLLGSILTDLILAFYPYPNGLSIALFLLPSFLVIGGALLLWNWGLSIAGRGLRRALYIGAFAGSIVWLGIYAGDFIAGDRSLFRAGYIIGARMAAEDRASAGLPPRTDRPRKLPTFPRQNPGRDLLNWSLLTCILGTVIHRLQCTTERASRHEYLASEATHRALRAKLAPHFIFNALNTLHAQIESDPRGAQATTERLADLFRQVVLISDRPTIPLREELAFVEAYLGIEQARLGERLKVRIEIPEELEETEIPPISLQILVENAVRHGVAPLETGGEIVVGGQREDANLIELWVEDPGIGISATHGTGTALETLRQRLGRPEDLRLEPSEAGFRASFRWRQA